MKLSELEPFLFLKDGEGAPHMQAEDFRAAHGMILLCPSCFAKTGHGKDHRGIQRERTIVGVHRPHVHFDSHDISGSGVEDLTLSEVVEASCGHRFRIIDGEVTEP